MPNIEDAPLIPPAAARPRVLVVDDSVDAAELLALILERKGCVVEAAHTGESALAAVQRMRPDIVLLDLGLPDIDGVTVARKLRTRSSHPVLIAVTGFAADSAQAGDSSLFSRFLVKPIDFAALDEILATLPQVAGAHQT